MAAVFLTLVLGPLWLSYVAPAGPGSLFRNRTSAGAYDTSANLHSRATVPGNVAGPTNAESGVGDNKDASESAPSDSQSPTVKTVHDSGDAFEWISFPYDTVVGDAGSIPSGIGFLSKDVSGLIDNPSCKALKEFAVRDMSEHPDGYSVELPYPFYGDDSMCGFVRNGDSVLFYVLGKAFIYESLPYLESDYLLIRPGKQGWYLSYPAQRQALNLKYELMSAAYVREHPSTEFPNAEFSKLYSILDNEQTKDLKEPAPELRHLFENMGSMAEYVELP